MFGVFENTIAPPVILCHEIPDVGHE
jgi:hypothetical protein